MKYGLMLATGQLGWQATPEVAGRLWRRLKDRMASCDLDVVNLHGCIVPVHVHRARVCQAHHA